MIHAINSPTNCARIHIAFAITLHQSHPLASYSPKASLDSNAEAMASSILSFQSIALCLVGFKLSTFFRIWINKSAILSYSVGSMILRIWRYYMNVCYRLVQNPTISCRFGVRQASPDPTSGVDVQDTGMILFIYLTWVVPLHGSKN